jgi:hypothetical protein
VQSLSEREWTKRASIGEGFSGLRAIPYSKVVESLCRQDKHDGSSSNPLAASLYGERSIIATNTSGSQPIMTDCFWRKADVAPFNGASLFCQPVSHLPRGQASLGRQWIAG